MFRKMRRGKQLLSQEDTDLVLQRGSNGILACLGDEDYPYAVPVSYVYHKGKIYFHSAKAGHKIDAIKKSSKVSLAVVDEDTISLRDGQAGPVARRVEGGTDVVVEGGAIGQRPVDLAIARDQIVAGFVLEDFDDLAFRHRDCCCSPHWHWVGG